MDIIKEELNNAYDRMVNKIRQTYRADIANGDITPKKVQKLPFVYPALNEDVAKIIYEWIMEGVAHIRSSSPSTPAERRLKEIMEGCEVYLYYYLPEFISGGRVNIYFVRENWVLFVISDKDIYSSSSRVYRTFYNEFSMSLKEVTALISNFIQQHFGVRLTPHKRSTTFFLKSRSKKHINVVS